MPKQRMKILLAIDDSKFSEAATRMLVEQNDPAKTTVRVLHVVEPIRFPYYAEFNPPYPDSLSALNKKRMAAAKQLVTRTASRLRAAGFRVENSSARPGNIRSMVVDTARKWRADLVVVGSHGRRGLARILLGSVSDYVAHHASCSVQIVRLSKRKS